MRSPLDTPSTRAICKSLVNGKRATQRGQRVESSLAPEQERSFHLVVYAYLTATFLLALFLATPILSYLLVVYSVHIFEICLDVYDHRGHGPNM